MGESLNGRKVFTTKEGEPVFEGAPRPNNMEFLVWLQHQRDFLYAKALASGDSTEIWRIYGLSDEELTRELGIHPLPPQGREDETPLDTKVA